ncbi:hypothetical protein [Streptomyces sp. NPDC051665]
MAGFRGRYVLATRLVDELVEAGESTAATSSRPEATRIASLTPEH